ncbi:MAG: cupin domain-containing protein [Planctomycetes bacterium]|nr:cupin domain-containing protein [Planctomycetota bacterium]
MRPFLLIALASFAASCQSADSPFTNGNLLTEVTEDPFGGAIPSPEGGLAVTNSVKVWEPGFQTPWHFHPFSGPATIIQGELTIDYDRETPIYALGAEKKATVRRTFKAGDSFMAVANTWHTSYNLGSEDLIFTVAWMGAKGQPLTQFHEEGE